jgi:hypothetical protein
VVRARESRVGSLVGDPAPACPSFRAPEWPTISTGRAERYGYVNRVIADDQLDDELDQIATRRGCRDHDAIASTKS